MKKTNLLKSMLLLCALVAGSGSVWAGDIYYSWDGSGSTTTANETGGTATAVQASGTNIEVGNSQKGNYTFKLNKGFSNGANYVNIALTNALKGGEKITLGVFRTTSNSEATLGFDFGTTATQTLKDDLQVLSSNGVPTDLVYTVPDAAAGSKVVRIYRNAGSTGAYVNKFIIESKEPTAPSAVEGHTITAVINSNGSCTCTPTSSIITTSGSASSTAKYGYDYGLKLESSKGVVTIALPSGAKNAQVDLLNSAAITNLKLDGTNTPVTYTGNADDGYVNSISIADSYAGNSYTIKKGGSGSPVIYKISLYYETASDTKVTLSTTANMNGWRTFYDGSQNYTVDDITSVFVADSDPVGTTITLKNIGKGIPSGVPVILKTTAANHKITLTKGGSATYEGTNKLAITSSGVAVSNKYRLGYNSTNGVGFYPYSVTKPDANIVYLDVSSASAHPLSIDFGDSETTAISEVRGMQTLRDDCYNLNGQRVNANHKGILIVNGKKFFNK